MIRKLLFAIAWILLLALVALGCWVAGLYLGWPLWRSIALFLGLILAGLFLRWLYHRWMSWRLRRRLARPVSGATAASTALLDADWRAGLGALKQSRLSRFGSPLYVLPWYVMLGPNDASRTELLRRAAGTAAVHARSDDPPVLQWWLLRNGVVIDPTEAMGEEHQAPDSTHWRRLLHWLMRVRRREPLNGVLLAFNVGWLTSSTDAELNEAGQGLRKRLDELTRVYDARIPVYVILTDCQKVPGFAAWAEDLGPELTVQAMGYINPAPGAGVGEFISAAFNRIVHRMFDLRVLQGVRQRPAPEAFALPERMVPLASRLSAVMRPAFQANPYAETPLMRGLFLVGQPAGNDRSESGWFSAGLFGQALPSQRHAWQPLERWRHWRRFLRGAAAVAWLGLCACAAVFLIHASNVAQDQVRSVAQTIAVSPDFSGGMSSDLHALQSERSAVHALLDRPSWERHWQPFQRRVNQLEDSLKQRFVRQFHHDVIAANLDPLLTSSLPQLVHGNNDRLLAAWAQTLVRRINLIDAALAHRDVYSLPAPGSELPMLLASANQTLRDSMDGILLGDMYRDYLTWQSDHVLLEDERRALGQVLASLNLTARPLNWIYEWVDLQGSIKAVRLTDFWSIPDQPDLPYIPAALTPDGERSATAFLDELGRATDNTEQWSDRRREFQQHFRSAGLDAWYRFADVFPEVPALLSDGTARRAVLSSLLAPDDPYTRLMHMLAAVADRLPASGRPDWLVQASQLDSLYGLARTSAKSAASSAAQSIDVVQRFGGEVIKALPQGGKLGAGLDRLRNEGTSLQLLQAYRQGVQETIVPLQQGDGTAMKAAIEIWSFGHDPKVKSMPLIDAQHALNALRAQQGTSGPRTNVVWDVAAGPMDFVLDYAARSAGCRLEQQWETTVLSAIQGVTDAELANTLLYGERGQVVAFLDGDVKHFVERDSVRYEARAAMGKNVPLNGQFYAFASMTQLRHVTLASQQLQSKRSSGEVAALTQQQTELAKQIAKLEATTGTVTLSTVPPQTNTDARALPESVSLTLQCASGAITLENLNFPNSAVFPWSLTTCGDTTLRIRYSDFVLTRQWPGATGFIQFLKEFSSGRRRYAPTDFPEQKTLMSVADIKWVSVTYQQQGQAPLVNAFNEVERLTAEQDDIKAKLAALQPGTAPGTTLPPPAPAPSVPRHIVSYCMGPVDGALADLETAAKAPPVPAPPAPAKRATPAPAKRATPASNSAGNATSPYVVQVGIFSHPEEVLGKLKKAGYTVRESDIALQGKEYKRIRVDGYASREAAERAAKKIGAMLKLKPEVIHVSATR